MINDIVNKKVQMKYYFSLPAKSLLEKLLERDPTKRIGSGSEDA